MQSYLSMKLSEFLNEVSKKGERLKKEDVKTYLYALNSDKPNLSKDVGDCNSGKATKHLVSNTENFTCFICQIPPGVKCDNVLLECDDLVILVNEGSLFVEKHQGAISSSFDKTISKDFRILSKGEVEIVKIPSGDISLSNPYSEDVIAVCVHLKSHQNIINEVSSLTAKFDSINGINV